MAAFICFVNNDVVKLYNNGSGCLTSDVEYQLADCGFGVIDVCVHMQVNISFL